jgi:acetyl esterase
VEFPSAGTVPPRIRQLTIPIRKAEDNMAGNPQNVALEPAAQAFVEATSEPPFLYDLGPEEGRKAVDSVQDSPIFKPEVDEEWITIQGGPTGSVPVRIVKPRGSTGTLPVILYTHGAGWVFGNAHTHDRLVRDLAVGSDAAVVFPEYDRAPEAKFPVPIEKCFTAAKWIFTDGAEPNHSLTSSGISRSAFPPSSGAHHQRRGGRPP